MYASFYKRLFKALVVFTMGVFVMRCLQLPSVLHNMGAPTKYNVDVQDEVIKEALVDDYGNFDVDDNTDIDKEFSQEEDPVDQLVMTSQVTPIDEIDERLKASLPLHYQPRAHVLAKFPTGRKFNVSRGLLQDMKLPPTKFVNLTNVTCEDFVFAITALRDTSMPKLTATVLRIQENFPGYRIIVIDLGLTKNDVDKVKSWCNVIYRLFDFSPYPNHVRKLRTYAWRPLVIQDLLRDFPGVFLIDQPFKINLSKFTDVLKKAISNGGVFTLKPTGHSVYSATNPEMYAYLPTNAGRLMTIRMWAFTNAMFFNTPGLYEGVLYWWYLCALDHNCISPSDNTPVCPLVSSQPNITHFSTYFKECHRHDQSALNVILANHFNFEVAPYSMFRPEAVFEAEQEVGDQRIRKCS